MTLNAPIIGSNTDTAQAFRLALGGLWVPASALNSRTGVTTVPTLTSTGNFTATVSAFTCIIDGTSNALQGSYPVANDAAATVTISAANTQARIDLISLQIEDTAYDSSGFSRGQFVVTAGTPSGSPVAPSTPANAIPLWTVPVAANATSVVFSSATAVFPYTATSGGIVPVRAATDKPAAANAVQYRHRLDVTAAAAGTSPLESSVDGVTWTPVWDSASLGRLVTCTSSTRPGSPVTGLQIFETDTGHLRVWSGSAWVFSVTPFAPQTYQGAAGFSVPSGVSTIGSTVSVTTDGATEIEIMLRWSGISESSASVGDGFTFFPMIDGSITNIRAFYNYRSDSTSGNLGHGGMLVDFTTPSSGTHTIAFGTNGGGLSGFTISNPFIRVQAVPAH